MTTALFSEVQAEMDRQVAKWGDQTHPSVSPTEVEALEMFYGRFRLRHGVILEEVAKKVCEVGAAEHPDDLAWADILTEEVAEAYGAEDEAHRRTELIQCMAVIGSWIRDLDRKAAAVAVELPVAA